VTSGGSLDVAQIRPARPSDERLSRTVGGRDAAPPEWDDWAEEPGYDIVAEEGGRIVGAIHVSIVGRAEAWMENLRVLPDFQGRGIAGQLVREAEHLAVHYGTAKLRTAIPAHEYAALAVAHRGGYHRVLQCVVLETPITAEPQHVPYDAPVEPPDVSAAPAVTGFVSATQTLQAWEQLLPLGWRFRRIVPELLRGLIRDKRVLVAVRADALRPGGNEETRKRGNKMGPARREEELQGAVLFADHQKTVVVSLLEGTASAVQATFGALVENRSGRAVVFTPDAQSLGPLGVREWVAHPWCPDGLVVVEKSVAS
ncbi:MAG: GNAT family N-acetyltransferase, partial [bacterium]